MKTPAKSNKQKDREFLFKPHDFKRILHKIVETHYAKVIVTLDKTNHQNSSKVGSFKSKGKSFGNSVGQGRHQDFNPTKAKIQNFNPSKNFFL